MIKPIKVVCPNCHELLDTALKRILCNNCNKSYSFLNGYLSFHISGEVDESFKSVLDNEVQIQTEEIQERRIINEWLLPIFKDLDVQPTSKILSIGCGCGADVETLREKDFEAYGTDLNYRTIIWSKKNLYKKHFYAADSRRLPFEDETFDVVYAFGVIEHIGASADSSYFLLKDFEYQRRQFFYSLFRVLKPGGHLIIASPNRLFPIDFQHSHEGMGITKKIYEKFGFCIHSPQSLFLLSYTDFTRFVKEYASRVVPLRLKNHIGFSRIRRFRFFQPLICVHILYSRILDNLPSPFRKSFINPFLLVAAQKRFI